MLHGIRIVLEVEEECHLDLALMDPVGLVGAASLEVQDL